MSQIGESNSRIEVYHLIANSPELVKKMMLAGVNIDTTLKILETAGEEFLKKIRLADEAKLKKDTEFLIKLAESLGENNLAELLRKNQAVKMEEKL